MVPAFPFPIRIEPRMPPNRLLLISKRGAVAVRLKTEVELRRILSRIIAGLDELADGMNSGVFTADAWQREVAQVLLVGHTAAYLAGRDASTLTPGARRQIAQVVGQQVDFLNRFADQVEAQGWQDTRDRARLILYAGACKGTYWRGTTFGLDMPFYPGDGSSECLGNCGCRLRVDWLDPEELDADVYWELGGAERHCATCPRRAAASPYRFRGGERQ
jgi:hypothetical protein